MGENDAFDAIVGDLELDLNDLPHYDYVALDNGELLQRYFDVKSELNERLALIHPETPEDQDLQGEYWGLIIELRKRGLK